MYIPLLYGVYRSWWASMSSETCTQNAVFICGTYDSLKVKFPRQTLLKDRNTHQYHYSSNCVEI